MLMCADDKYGDEKMIDAITKFHSSSLSSIGSPYNIINRQQAESCGMNQLDAYIYFTSTSTSYNPHCQPEGYDFDYVGAKKTFLQKMRDKIDSWHGDILERHK